MHDLREPVFYHHTRPSNSGPSVPEALSPRRPDSAAQSVPQAVSPGPLYLSFGGRVVPAAGLDFVVSVTRPDIDSAEGAIVALVGGRVTKQVLGAQFLGHCAKGRRHIEPPVDSNYPASRAVGKLP